MTDEPTETTAQAHTHNQANGGAHVCLDKRVPQQLMLAAAELAVAENPENAPSGATASGQRKIGVDPAGSREMFGAILTGKKWKVGRTLRVRHLDGDPVIHAKVERFAREWENHANIKFEFVDAGTAEIRISYHLDNSSWSYIGTDALAIPKNQETMHYGWLRTTTPEKEVRRVVLHEFGHAIGMIHEQSQPASEIQWDKAAVYRQYEAMGWTRAQVDANVFEHYGKQGTQFTQWDARSIMHYPVPPEFTTNGISVGLNTDLSPMDKQFIGDVYPGVKQGAPPPGAVGAAPQASVAATTLEIKLP